jgi:hypothetical protein
MVGSPIPFMPVVDRRHFFARPLRFDVSNWFEPGLLQR